MRKLSGFSFILLIVVMAIVLILAAKAWQAMAPTAIDITSPQLSDFDRPTGPGHLPNLDEMKRNTKEHTERIQDIRKQID